jgi:acetyl esterase/lipase
MPSIPLWDGPAPASAAEDDFQPTLDLFLCPGGGERGAIVVCPGGGYSGRADHEGAPIAEAANAAGLHAFVLQYRVAPNQHPAPLLDASRAVRLVRARAAEWGVLPGKVHCNPHRS